MFIIFKHLVAGLCSLGLWSFPFAATGDETQAKLTLTPRLCVLGAAEQECTGTVTLHWQASARINTCLFQDGREAPLNCWQQTQLGSFTISPKANRSLRFYLAATDGRVLAEGKFQVLQQQNAHRKRRNPWSFY